MGQEKTQRENGREQRNEQQGRFVREGGPQGPPVVPCQHGVRVRSRGHRQPLTWWGQPSLSLKFWGLVHSCLGLTIQPPSSRPSLPWTRAPSMPSSDGEANPGARMLVA